MLPLAAVPLTAPLTGFITCSLGLLRSVALCFASSESCYSSMDEIMSDGNCESSILQSKFQTLEVKIVLGENSRER